MSTFQQILVQAGFEVQSYSGRGMYGKRCLAVTGKGDTLNVVANIVVEVTNHILDNLSTDEMVGALQEMKAAFCKVRTDSLGRDSVVYFPTIEFVEEESEGEHQFGMDYEGGDHG